MSVFKPTSPAVLPNPVNVWDGTVATKTDLVCCVPSFIEVNTYFAMLLVPR